MTSLCFLCCWDGVLDLLLYSASQQVFLSAYFGAQHLMFKPSPEGYSEINLVRGWDHWSLCMWATANPSAEAGETLCVRA